MMVLITLLLLLLLMERGINNGMLDKPVIHTATAFYDLGRVVEEK